MVSKFMATPRHTLFEPKSIVAPIQEFYDLPIFGLFNFLK